MSKPVTRQRWTPNRKAELVESIAAGELTEAEACVQHGLSLEELNAWKRDARRGVPALRVSSVAEQRARTKPAKVARNG